MYVQHNAFRKRQLRWDNGQNVQLLLHIATAAHMSASR